MKPGKRGETRSLILGLHGDGLTTHQIADRLGCSEANVRLHLRKAGLARSGRQAPQRPAHGRWDEAKRDKAIRLYQKIVVFVAEALGVPPAELLAFWSKGKLPAERGPASEIAGTAVPAAAPEATGGGVTVPQPPPAGLPAVIEAKPDAPAPARLYRLRSMDGSWLSRDGEAFTRQIDAAWTGTADQASTVRQRKPLARYCKLREVGDE